MNTIVNFELAKLLKEKGFDELCDKKYIAQCLWQSPNSRKQYKNSEIHENSSDVSAPTITEVVMWLYEKHGIWVTVNPNHSFKYWSVNLVTDKNANDNLHDATIFDSPTEAYEAAIEYILNNLI